jgi:hypothetical protein
MRRLLPRHRENLDTDPVQRLSHRSLNHRSLNHRSLKLDRLALKTGAAQNRTALIWPEGYRCFGAASGANRSSFWSFSGGGSGAFSFAVLAVFWVVGEAFGMEEQLFIRGEDEVFAADDALQSPIFKLHFRLSDCGLDRSLRMLQGSSKTDRQNHICEFKTGARAAP